MVKRYIGSGIWAEIYSDARICLIPHSGTKEIWMDVQAYTRFADFVIDEYGALLRNRGFSPDMDGGLRSRSAIENLLDHLKAGQCHDTPEGTAAGIRILEWVLNRDGAGAPAPPL